jgi:hypothetical protein
MGLTNPTVSLGVLGRYSHIIWMTDRAVSNIGAPNATTNPLPTLTYMSGLGRQNTLATWVSQGGQLWGLGCGFGNATNLAWNKETNDLQVRTYSALSTPPDLTPGRFMFDLAHWRSEFRVYGPAFVSYMRYDRPDPIVNATSWKGGTFTNPDVDYSTLPTSLQPRSPATDPIWPYRNNTEFYIGNNLISGLGLDLEFLSAELYMTEEIPVPSPTNPDSTVERSTLDSLYLGFANYPGKMLTSGQGVNVLMTYYHGRENPPLVFSGTSIWDFRRQDCVGLVDFVLNKLWGLQRRTLYTAPRSVASSVARRPAVPAQTLQRPSGPARQPVGTSTFQRWRCREPSNDSRSRSQPLRPCPLLLGAGLHGRRRESVRRPGPVGRDAEGVLAHPGLGPVGGVAGRHRALPQALHRTSDAAVRQSQSEVPHDHGAFPAQSSRRGTARLRWVPRLSVYELA